jgi:hypothetical protein
MRVFMIALTMVAARCDGIEAPCQTSVMAIEVAERQKITEALAFWNETIISPQNLWEVCQLAKADLQQCLAYLASNVVTPSQPSGGGWRR